MLLHAGVLYVGAIDGSIRAIDALTGQPRWTTPLRGVGVNGLALDGNVLYATLSFTGRSGPGAVYGLAVGSGAIGLSIKASAHVSTGPAIAEGRLLFGTSVGSIVDRSGELLSIDLASRSVRTLHHGGACVGTPVVDGEDVLIACDDGTVRCMDRSTGVVRWKFATAKFMAGSPSVSSDMVLIGGFDHFVYAVDKRSGTERWRFKCGGPVRGTPVADPTTVFVASYDEKLHALDAITGKRRWEYQATSFVLTTPAIGDGLVIVGCNDGSVHAVDAASGAQAWMWPGDDPMQRGVIAQPLIVGDRVLIGSRTGRVFALDLRTGATTTSGADGVSKADVAGDTRGSTLSMAAIGRITLPSGRIVACDSMTDLAAAPLARHVKPGTYPVFAGMLTDHRGTRTVAWLYLQIADEKPTRWERAGDEGIVVDSGTAAILSAELAARASQDPAREESFGEAIEAQMDASYGAGMSWAVVGDAPGAAPEAAVCHAGAGDGIYDCWWGLTKRGRPVCLAIDFAVADAELASALDDSGILGAVRDKLMRRP
jgi:outer membrane protein assembly factor BamB